MDIRADGKNLVADDGGNNMWVRTAEPWDNLREVRQWVREIAGDTMTAAEASTQLTSFSVTVAELAREALNEQTGEAEMAFDPAHPLTAPTHERPETTG